MRGVSKKKNINDDEEKNENDEEYSYYQSIGLYPCIYKNLFVFKLKHLLNTSGP